MTPLSALYQSCGAGAKAPSCPRARKARSFAEMYISAGWSHSRGQAVSTIEARERLADIVNRAAYGKERAALSRRGKPIAAIVPIQDLEILEAIEARLDAEAYRKAKAAFTRKGEDAVAWTKIKTELGRQAAQRSRRRPSS